MHRAGATADAEHAETHRATAGLAHVAAVSFVASRAAPTAGFWIALAGGVALARAARRSGREGYGASLAAMLQSVAIMGPARFSIPLTQGLNAPVVGRLEARGAPAWAQVVVAALIRAALIAAGTAFFIFVVLGGLDAYVGTYDALAGGIPAVPEGTGWALGLYGALLLGWTIFASVIQIAVYRRGLAGWPETARSEREPRPAAADDEDGRGFDPRAVFAAAAIVSVALLASTQWAVLAASAFFLLVAWPTSRPRHDAVLAGAVIAALLALTAFAFALGGSLGLDVALRRAARVALLVACATWLRAAAGPGGLREVSRRMLHRLRGVPSVREAERMLADLGADPRLAPAARSVVEHARAAPRRPLAIADAVLRWIPDEVRRFVPTAPAPPHALRLRARDAALLVLVAPPVAALSGLLS
jgi:hypothetical protein